MIEEIIYSGRRTGRTQHLINMAAEAEENGEVCYIVCGTHDQAYQIAQRAKEQGLSIGFPLTYHEFMMHQYAGQNIDKFFIDNADHLLQMIAGGKIEAITLEKRESDNGYDR